MKKTAGIMSIAAVVLACLEMIRELSCFSVVHYQIKTSKFKEHRKEQKIIFLSDLHNREYGKNNKRLIKAIKKEQPDLILVTGDMLIGKRGCSFAKAAAFMKRLPQVAPVYYANGNHEQRLHVYEDWYGDMYRDYKKELENAGVTFLVNESCERWWHGIPEKIYGIEVPMECYARRKAHRLQENELIDRVGKTEEENYNIVLAHNPADAEVYREWGADLILSGHLHGGIVRIPFLGGLIDPQAGLFPRYSGNCYQEGETTIVVSKGLGTHTVNIRLLNPAELIVLHVRGKG